MKECFIIVVLNPGTLTAERVFVASESPQGISRIFDGSVYAIVLRTQEDSFQEALDLAIDCYNADTNLAALRAKFPLEKRKPATGDLARVRIATDLIPSELDVEGDEG